MTRAGRCRVSDRSAGVTLIELMVVLVVVAIGVMALSAIQTRASTDVYTTGRETRALRVGQTRMEMACGAGYALAVSDSGTTDGFGWRTVVDSADAGLNRVRVTVTWTDKHGARSIELSNLLALR
jgi:prepilin-type N-terminal cleavage/methylation domain-containing protein